MATYKQGTVFKAWPNIGSYAAPSYTSLEGETSMSFEVSTAMIDVTNKSSSNNRRILAGVRSSTYNVTMVYDEDATAPAQIITDILAGTLTKVELKTLDTYKYSGDGYFSNVQITSDHDGAVTMTATFEFDGAVTQAAA